MDALRASLDNDVEEVATSVRAITDWRFYVQNHPWLTLGAATAFGYLLVPRRVQQVDRLVPEPEVLARLAKEEKLVMSPDAEVRATNDGIVNKLVSLALAAGSRAAVGYFGNKLGSVFDSDAASDQQASYVYAAAKPK